MCRHDPIDDGYENGMKRLAVCKVVVVVAALILEACSMVSVETPSVSGSVDVKAEENRYREYFYRLNKAFDGGTFFEKELHEPDPWGHPLVESNENGMTIIRSHGVCLEDSHDDIIIIFLENSMEMKYRYNDSRGSLFVDY